MHKYVNPNSTNKKLKLEELPFDFEKFQKTFYSNSKESMTPLPISHSQNQERNKVNSDSKFHYDYLNKSWVFVHNGVNWFMSGDHQWKFVGEKESEIPFFDSGYWVYYNKASKQISHIDYRGKWVCSNETWYLVDPHLQGYFYQDSDSSDWYFIDNDSNVSFIGEIDWWYSLSDKIWYLRTDDGDWYYNGSFWELIDFDENHFRRDSYGNWEWFNGTDWGLFESEQENQEENSLETSFEEEKENPHFDIGHEKGYNEGHGDGYDEGYEEGYEEGQTSGYNEGYNEGQTDGFEKGIEKGLLRGLEKGGYNGYIKGYLWACDLFTSEEYLEAMKESCEWDEDCENYTDTEVETEKEQAEGEDWYTNRVSHKLSKKYDFRSVNLGDQDLSKSKLELYKRELNLPFTSNEIANWNETGKREKRYSEILYDIQRGGSIYEFLGISVSRPEEKELLFNKVKKQRENSIVSDKVKFVFPEKEKVVENKFEIVEENKVKSEEEFLVL